MKINPSCKGCFAGLSCSIRIEIVNLLKKKKRMSVLEIAKHFEVTQPTISHHLKYLEESKVVCSKKEGRKVYYSIRERCKDCDLLK